MKRLAVKNCLWPHTKRVLEEERPEGNQGKTIYAVFSGSVENGAFCGITTAHDIALHPSWIFADLTEHRPTKTLTPDITVQQALKVMDENDVNALPIVDAQKNFIGVVTRQSIMEALLSREHELLKESNRLHKLLNEEHRQVVAWSERLSELHSASRALLGVLSQTSLERDLLQLAIDSLTKLLQARYGAIGLVEKDGSLSEFIHTGIDPEQARLIGHPPEGRGLLGVVIQDNVSLRLDDMSKDSRSTGFPIHHPPMKSLLAVPISHADRVYGRIYLSDKISSEPFSKDDEVLAQSFAHSLSLVLDNAREIEVIKQTQKHLDYLAHFDALTGLPNRTLLTDRIQQVLAHAQRNGSRVAFLYIDLDNFKNVNDTLGHSKGDQLLQKAATRISECLRVGDTVARMGGDEFIVMLPELPDVQDAGKVAIKILESAAMPFDVDQHEIYVGASIGISIYPDDAANIEELLSNSDSAMYHAKKLGKNTYHYFSAELNRASQEAAMLERHLRRALERNELFLNYQPQIDLLTDAIVGMEALLRWDCAELGVVPPEKFIPLAEETGLIIPISNWVLETACRQAKMWQKSGTPVRVAVNLSARQFQRLSQSTHEESLLDMVLRVLEMTELPAHLLELEITESIMMLHVDDTLHTLDELKKIGIRISVDDFGTGYSSLSYLKRFPVDALKIDKSFIRDVALDSNDAAIVSAIGAMALQLNLSLVAEGVETQEQLEFLQKIQCHSIQGYYFSQPVNTARATELLRQGFLRPRF